MKDSLTPPPPRGVTCSTKLDFAVQYGLRGPMAERPHCRPRPPTPGWAERLGRRPNRTYVESSKSKKATVDPDKLAPLELNSRDVN